MAMAAPAARIYEDFDPSVQIIDDNDCETIRVSVPGFRRDKLKVQLTSTNLVRISGEREIEASKSLRFQKEFLVKSNIDTNRISAKFEQGILNVKLPKLIIPEDKRADNKPLAPQTPKPEAPQTPKPEASAEKPPPQKLAAEMAGKSDGSNQQASTELKDEPMSKEEEKLEKDGPRRGEVSEESRQENYQVTAADLASKLKMSRRLAYVVLVAFAAVGLGLYATKFIRTYGTCSEFSG